MLLIGFCLLSVFTGIFFTGEGFPQNLTQIVWGAKYGLLFFVLFFCVRSIPFSAREKDTLVNIALFSGVIVLLFGFLQATVLPETVLISFGYSPEYGNTEISGGISYCHKIENSLTHEEFCRVQSTLSGPNQLGAYLLFLLPFLWYRGLRKISLFTRLFFFSGFFIGAAAFLFTWSRSAWIGSIAMASAFFVLHSKRPLFAFLFLIVFLLGIFSLFSPLFLGDWDELKTFAVTASLGMLLLLLFFFAWNIRVRFFSCVWASVFPLVLTGIIAVRAYYDTFFWNIIYRPSSSQGHWERWKDGGKYILENPLGLGLGDAGPASARFAHAGETGFLPESWYLQVGLESGVLGLLLFLALLISVGTLLLKSKNEYSQPLFLGLIGISVASLFLHTWESAAITLSFWSLVAIILSPEKHSLIQKNS